MHDLAKLAGWKRSGIIASNKRYILELNGTSRIEMPIMNNGEILVDEDYLDLLVNEANLKLNESWELIERLERGLN